MATMTSRVEGGIQVPEFLQTLIDSRLDTIDRMLLGRLPRAERLEIVREVESQVFEQLQELAGRGELTREDVLDALRRLDPPEAYLPEENGAVRSPRVAAAVRLVPSAARPGVAARPRSPVGLTSGILGIIALVEVVLHWPLIMGVAQVFSGASGLILAFWYLLCLMSLVLAIMAIVLAARVRLAGPWAIVGLITGILGLLGSLVFTVMGIL